MQYDFNDIYIYKYVYVVYVICICVIQNIYNTTYIVYSAICNVLGDFTNYHILMAHWICIYKSSIFQVIHIPIPYFTNMFLYIYIYAIYIYTHIWAIYNDLSRGHPKKVV